MLGAAAAVCNASLPADAIPSAFYARPGACAHPAAQRRFEQAMALTRREVIGDAQAGMAVRVGEVDIALSYVMREYRHVAGTNSFDEDEQFAAVTVNWSW